MSWIKSYRKLFEDSRMASQVASSRKNAQHLCSNAFHFSWGFLGHHPHRLHCLGGGTSNQGSPIIEDGFSPPACTHPSHHLSSLSPPLLSVFYPTSKSFSLWHPPKFSHTGEGGRSGVLTIFPQPSLSGGSLLCNLNMKDCPLLEAECGQCRVLKKTFWGQIERNPRA